MGKIATGVKAGSGGTVLALATVPEDSAGLLRLAADMIESGEHTPFWLLALGLWAWAAWDVWTWFKRRRLSKTESEPSPPSGQITPKDTITEHGVLTLYETGYPKSLTPWEDLKKGKQANHPAGPPPQNDTTPMQGIAELERCQQALVKYMAIPLERPVGRAEIAGSVELYPYMTDLCRVLNDQGIPHPEIDYRGLTIVDTGKWRRFLGDLWAVRHDLERAKCVHQGHSKADSA
ncbi:MAG: hypothetical protein OXC08_20660 [Thiotrichales bacterium]|nr:hypothetical protein [Thiotrichales bacterium]